MEHSFCCAFRKKSRSWVQKITAKSVAGITMVCQIQKTQWNDSHNEHICKPISHYYQQYCHWLPLCTQAHSISTKWSCSWITYSISIYLYDAFWLLLILSLNFTLSLHLSLKCSTPKSKASHDLSLDSQLTLKYKL